jgi:hypothetical protein
MTMFRAHPTFSSKKLAATLLIACFSALPSASSGTPISLDANGVASPPVTVDFATAPSGAFQSTFFQSEGVVFSESDGFVGFIQGQNALLNAVSPGYPQIALPIVGDFSPGITSLSISVAPAVQGVMDFTLTAIDASAANVKSLTVEVNQWTSDPGFQGFGYQILDLGTLPQTAVSFSLSVALVRGPEPLVQFAIGSLTFAQIPEPSSIGLLSAGIIGLIACRRSRLRAEC